MSNTNEPVTYQREINCGSHRGRCVVDLSLGTFHELTLVGDCEIVLSNGKDDCSYQLRVTQDAVGGHQANFSNLLTKDAEHLLNTKEPHGSSIARFSAAASGYYLTGHWFFSADPVSGNP